MTAPKPRPGILDIAPYVPGVSKAPGAARVFKLSSNESPLGASPKALAALARADGVHLYPDGACSALREALARRHGLEAARILCGNGSNEVIGFVAQAYLDTGDGAVISRHAFSEFEIVVRSNGGVPVFAPERDFTAQIDAILARVTPRTRMVFLANPNNPTGTFISGHDIRRLHAGLPPHVILLLDEAYAEYAHQPWESGLELARSAENVVVTRTFSKIFGLAALRVGWGYFPHAMAQAVNRIRYPFNVGTLAQVAGLAALDDEAFATKNRTHNATWRPWLAGQIAALGVEVTPSAANFLLVHLPRENQAGAAYDYLLKQGVIVRPLSGYGLGGSLRVSVGTEDGNRALAAGLKGFLEQ
jgi:histidinol-phosphate aminotransferase